MVICQRLKSCAFLPVVNVEPLSDCEQREQEEVMAGRRGIRRLRRTWEKGGVVDLWYNQVVQLPVNN
eukprot:767096-Hanusia_phi.AAC.9